MSVSSFYNTSVYLIISMFICPNIFSTPELKPHIFFPLLSETLFIHLAHFDMSYQFSGVLTPLVALGATNSHARTIFFAPKPPSITVQKREKKKASTRDGAGCKRRSTRLPARWYTKKIAPGKHLCSRSQRKGKIRMWSHLSSLFRHN